MGIFDVILYKGDKEKEEKELIENNLGDDDFRLPEKETPKIWLVQWFSFHKEGYVTIGTRKETKAFISKEEAEIFASRIKNARSFLKDSYGSYVSIEENE